ncbi:uncharacterized protein [Pyxicephalus adspersus]|uniref:Uncharacterized protein n=1 Tax=Pyxicephalus adspersus TaxID=30357 RepID=A0AAV3A2A9_PYXAD|nr:TPA: hypothetical protein GDO54_014958 [Pyxicephalus adspersus]DBA19085.1 TPA: hypothetical protein GDO54_014958 [Pyxicephalus adspersus]
MPSVSSDTPEVEKSDDWPSPTMQRSFSDKDIPATAEDLRHPCLYDPRNRIRKKERLRWSFPGANRKKCLKRQCSHPKVEDFYCNMLGNFLSTFEDSDSPQGSYSTLDDSTERDSSVADVLERDRFSDDSPENDMSLSDIRESGFSLAEVPHSHLFLVDAPESNNVQQSEISKVDGQQSPSASNVSSVDVTHCCASGSVEVDPIMNYAATNATSSEDPQPEEHRAGCFSCFGRCNKSCCATDDYTVLDEGEDPKTPRRSFFQTLLFCLTVCMSGSFGTRSPFPGY